MQPTSGASAAGASSRPAAAVPPPRCGPDAGADRRARRAAAHAPASRLLGLLAPQRLLEHRLGPRPVARTDQNPPKMPRHHDCTGMKRRRSVNSTTASHHCAARSRSARSSQTTRVVQQASPQASGSFVSPPSATVIASSSSATPSVDPALAHDRRGRAARAPCTRRPGRRARARRPARPGRAARRRRDRRPLGLLDRQPASSGAAACPASSRSRAREPPIGRGLAGRRCDVRRPGRREAARAPGVAAALIRRVGLAAAIDRPRTLAEPPQRLAQTVERLGIARVLLEAPRRKRHAPSPSPRARSAPSPPACRSSARSLTQPSATARCSSAPAR